MQNPVAIVLVIAVGRKAVAIAQVVKDAGLSEALQDEMALLVGIRPAVEQYVGPGRQAAVQALAASADGTDDVRSRLKRGDGGGHLAVGDVVDVLVDGIGDEGRQIRKGQSRHDNQCNRPADHLPEHGSTPLKPIWQ
ncbi:hypothetical protein [Bradyrhizobium liaoningense]